MNKEITNAIPLHHPAGHPGGHPAGEPGGAPGGPGGDFAPGGKFDPATLTDTAEKGKGGQRSERRLYLQLLVFDGASDSAPLVEALSKSKMEAVLYVDLNSPERVGLLTMSEDPDFFVTELRTFLQQEPFAPLLVDPEMTMFGRSYGLGHEEDLQDWLTGHCRRVSRSADASWAVWYPLRRNGDYAKLSPKEQGEILMEHGMIGRAFGQAGLGRDIRLTCFGLDKNDNDFVIGLIGTKLLPLSKLVQTMRATKQTSTYIDSLGPFFIGKAVWQAPLAEGK
jgi:chlorite dismutase